MGNKFHNSLPYIVTPTNSNETIFKLLGFHTLTKFKYIHVPTNYIIKKQKNYIWKPFDPSDLKTSSTCPEPNR